MKRLALLLTLGSLLFDSAALAQVSGSVAIRDGASAKVATVKAGSTAAAAADQPVVVALHPTSPLPAGSNSIGTVVLGAGSATVGSVKLTDGTTTVAVIAATSALKVDLSSVAGSATNTGNGTAAGSQRVAIASDNSPISVTPGGAGAFTCFKTSNTTSAAAFATNTSKTAYVRSDPLNTDVICIGGSAVTVSSGVCTAGTPLYIGEGLPIEAISNTNLIYGIANAGTQVSYTCFTN